MFGLFKSDTKSEYPPLTFFNTETKTKNIFTPLKAHKVSMYSCGPTVYDYAHIGNLRAYVFVDIVKRALFLNGYDVNHTINLTDFGHLTSDGDTGDDKMMKGLKRENMDVTLENMLSLAERYIKAFQDDLAELNVTPPTQYARASDYIREQIRLITTLDEKGYLYQTSDGVYFDITKFPTYGRLGNIDVDALRSGARVEANPEKKHPADFAVWKNGELGWDSTWGKGFPGWHIECSAMAFATLGKQIDIHTGGVDHISTHHNGEIAQSEAVSGKQFVQYWLHNEHLQINDDKIAKSAGNSLTLPELNDQGISGEEYRYWLLTSHYRTQVNVNSDALQGAKQALQRLKRHVYEDWADEKGALNHDYFNGFVAAINDDLDTAKAIALIWDLVKDENIPAGEKRITIQECDAVLGIGLSLDTEEGLRALGQLESTDIPEDVQQLINDREASRIAQNWAEADRLREEISLKGFAVEDTATGPKVSKN